VEQKEGIIINMGSVAAVEPMTKCLLLPRTRVFGAVLHDMLPRGVVTPKSRLTAICLVPRGCAYAATKHGLRGWSLSCYQNLREHNIKVVLINPGEPPQQTIRTMATCTWAYRIMKQRLHVRDTVCRCKLRRKLGPRSLMRTCRICSTARSIVCIDGERVLVAACRHGCDSDDPGERISMFHVITTSRVVIIACTRVTA